MLRWTLLWKVLILCRHLSIQKLWYPDYCLEPSDLFLLLTPAAAIVHGNFFFSSEV